MWISRASFEKANISVVEAVMKAQGERNRLEIENARLRADMDWFKLRLAMWPERQFAGNKNALNLRLEWGLKGTGVIPAESRQEIGIQRVQSWLLTGKLTFAYTAKRTIEQCGAYRYADNTKPSTGEKRVKELVFKLKDELPDALRYALMAWPELPDPDEVPLSEAAQARLDAFDDKTRWDLKVAEEMRKKKQNKGVELQPDEDGFPTGNVFQHNVMDLFGPGNDGMF